MRRKLFYGCAAAAIALALWPQARDAAIAQANVLYDLYYYITTTGMQGPIGNAAGAITNVATSSADNKLVVKNAPGNFYSAYAINGSSTPGFMIVVDAQAAPGTGAVTPKGCVPLPANGIASINNKGGPPQLMANGAVVLLSSAANCFTYTTGAITGFISGDAK
jgi:hypothetical protein